MTTGVQAQDRALYISRDSGESWKTLCSHLGIVSLFVHPDTGVLYAIIGENDALRGDRNGNLKRGLVMKVVMSKDGVDWKDITPEEVKLGAVSTSIAKDPNNPGRIVVILGGFSSRSYTVIRWLDDAYRQSERLDESIDKLFFDR